VLFVTLVGEPGGLVRASHEIDRALMNRASHPSVTVSECADGSCFDA
jgi:hypothetical protein